MLQCNALYVVDEHTRFPTYSGFYDELSFFSSTWIDIECLHCVWQQKLDKLFHDFLLDLINIEMENFINPKNGIWLIYHY